MKTPKFWPLDDDYEPEIFDTPSWTMPGVRKRRGVRSALRPRAIKPSGV